MQRILPIQIPQETISDFCHRYHIRKLSLFGSRWTEKCGSYRTVQRFFKEKIDWSKLCWQLIKQHTQGVKGT